MRQTWIDKGTKLNLIKKLSAMIDHVGSPGHLGASEPTEYAVVLTSNYSENSMQLPRADDVTDPWEPKRPRVRDRHHWPDVVATGAGRVRCSALNFPS